jgi:predicted TIM-barrel fold metal-dependent hydrolase
MPDVDRSLRPWLDRLLADLGPVEFFDAHTHVGCNDPDGFKQTPEELLKTLAHVDARAAVFPSHEPDGYSDANDAVIEAAARSGGLLVAFCRVDPAQDPLKEARRCFDAGARGIKLHPRAEQFTLSHPAIRDLVALAHEQRAPVLIHAGRGIPALGQDTVRLSEEFPGARMILAHAAISDLAWLWKVMPDHPNLFIDTAWWTASDLLAMFALVPPAHLLWASDSPYGTPVSNSVMAGRSALQAGVTPEQLRAIFGEQTRRVIDGEDPLELGPAPGPQRALDPLLERLVMHLTSTAARAFVGADFQESLGLARLSCAVGEDDPHAQVHAEVLELLNLFEAELEPPPPGRGFPLAYRYLAVAAVLARTPDVPLPERPHAPRPIREQAE